MEAAVYHTVYHFAQTTLFAHEVLFNITPVKPNDAKDYSACFSNLKVGEGENSWRKSHLRRQQSSVITL